MQEISSRFVSGKQTIQEVIPNYYARLFATGQNEEGGTTSPKRQTF